MCVAIFSLISWAALTILSQWKPPQLIFVECPPDPAPEFFLMMLSKAGDRLTLMDAPYELSEGLGVELRSTFPKKITADRATEDGQHVFEIKRSSYGGASGFVVLFPSSISPY